MIEPGRWARVHRVELEPLQRATDLPADTAAVPFETWINGWLVDGAELGGAARLRTPSGRVVEGRLVAVDPGYDHTFGSPPLALQRAGERSRELLFG